MNIDIKLLEGLNDLEFGMSRQAFEEKMGAPAQEEVISEPEDSITSLLLEYPAYETSFFFEGKDGRYHLSSCDTENKEALLFGRKIFDLELKRIIELFKTMGYEQYETKTEEWGEMRLTFDNAMADLYFIDGKLSSIIWGY